MQTVVMVPAEPTEAMALAALKVSLSGSKAINGVDLWRAMVEAGAVKVVRTIGLTVGEPRRKLEIEGSPSDGYRAYLTDSDGNLFSIGDGQPSGNPFEVADWCERNGFAWEVIGAVGDPVAALAVWRAEQ